MRILVMEIGEDPGFIAMKLKQKVTRKLNMNSSIFSFMNFVLPKIVKFL